MCGEIVEADGNLGEACVNIRGGLVYSWTEEPRGEHVIDVRGTGYKIIPGLVDLHVHLRGLLLSYKEDEETGTREAARAGITLVADMPNTKPRLDTPRALAAKLEALASKSIVDYTVYAAIPRDPSTVDLLASKPIAGFKVYPQDYGREASLQRAARLATLIVVHPELPEAEGPVSLEDPASRNAHRGCHLEAAAPSLLAPLLDGAKVHVTHASCTSTVREAKRLGYTVDVAPHHIIYNARPRGDPCTSRVNPPLRDNMESHRLAQLIIEGSVDALASDHAPHAWWEKTEPLTCRPGYPWLGLWPWAARAALGLTLQELVELASRRPAEILGIYPAYGTLTQGARANIAIVDPDTRWRHTGFHHSKHGLPAHFMLEAKGNVEYTIVGGILVYDGSQTSTNYKPGVNSVEWSRNNKIP